MRKILAVGALIMSSSAVYAVPSPPPPEDFSGAQYIDGEGCVFTRKGDDWALRLDDKGVRICGFPPTLAVRRTDPDTVSVLPSTNEPKNLAEHFEEDLLTQLAGGLRAGEFVADHHHEQEKRLAAKSEGDGGMKEQVDKLSRLHKAMEVATASGLANSELCSRLGYEPNPNPKPIMGGDVTQGMCPGMQPTMPKMHGVANVESKAKTDIKDGADIAAAESQGEVEKTASLKKGQVGPFLPVTEVAIKPYSAERPVGGIRQPAILSLGDGATIKQPPIEAAGEPVSRADTKIAATNPTAASEKTNLSEKHMIGAKKPQRRPVKPKKANNRSPDSKDEKVVPSAKYVEVGSFSDHKIAAIAMRQLTKMGYSVAKADRPQGDRTFRHVLAGPFNDQDSLVEALNSLRNSGYADALPR